MNITVTMPYYQVGPDIRRAVLSIVNQTYPHWQLIVINDADPNPPWRWIDDIDDPRIVRFDMAANHGRYFADAVIFEACRPDAWAMQDPDDYAEPDRFEQLMPLAAEYGFAVAPFWWHKPSGTVLYEKNLDPKLHPEQIRGINGYGSAVTTGERIGRAGGFAPQYRIGFDTYLMNALTLTGRCAVYGKPLQNKTQRPGSLTQDPKTKWGSPARKKVRRELNHIWRSAYQRHITGQSAAKPVRDSIPVEVAEKVNVEAERLRNML